MRPFCLLTIAAASASFASSSNAQTAAQDQIRAKAKEMVTAVNTDKPEKMVDLIYPRAVEMAGGRAKMLGMIRTMSAEMKKEKFKLDAVEIGQPSEPVPSGDKLFCFVPETVHLSNPETKITSPGYLLAVSSDKGKTWTFLDGAGLSPEKVKAVIPDFPDTLKLPEKKEPLVEPVPWEPNTAH